MTDNDGDDYINPPVNMVPMPLAEKYECYSVRQARRDPKIPPGGVEALVKAGLGCAVTAEQTERIARFVAKQLRVRLQTVYIKNVGGGHAHREGKSITIPHWVIHRQGKAYIVAYIAHEVAHLHKSSHHHEKSFKRVERRALKIFGMGIRYRHAYARELYVLKTGKKLWIKASAPLEKMERVLKERGGP